ncbi:FkbM family methyltransferase [Halorubrum sp. BV1]|uniref:FkbM family methyltransferase n=1 Tax=Halorubrum sp. BV1 TaxID=1498500 RepID=UPI0018AD168E|nr:FkbM family methyltransferase [Halorubrum sp. BV1]
MYGKLRTALNILYTEGPHVLCREFYSVLKDVIQNQLINKTGRDAIRDRFEDVKMLIDKENPVIVDGGAHKGSTINQFGDVFSDPTIHAFEANPYLSQKLTNNMANDTGINIYNRALGSENTSVKFNINKNDATSSVLESSEINFSHQGEGVETEEEVNVEQVRIDKYIENAPDIIKLDLQGYELEALKGASGHLPNTKLILTEVEFLELYKEQPLFTDIVKFLRGKNFRLFNLYELWTREDGQLTAGDAIFVNNDFYEPNDF